MNTTNHPNSAQSSIRYKNLFQLDRLTSTINIDPKKTHHQTKKKNLINNNNNNNNSIDQQQQQQQQSPIIITNNKINISPSDLSSSSLADQSSASAASSSSQAWTITDRLRLWRDDARAQHLYQTAAFWGSKVFNLTCNPNDAFWLAQVFFLTGQFFRAEKILTSTRRIRSHHLIDQNQNQDKSRSRSSSPDHQLDRSQDDDDDLPQDFSFWDDLLPSSSDIHPQQYKTSSNEPSSILVRMTDFSTACRYLAAQAMIRQAKWDAALEMLGDENPFNPQAQAHQPSQKNSFHLLSPTASPASFPTRLSQQPQQPSSSPSSPSDTKELNKKNYLQQQAGQAAIDGGIKFESSMCYLRGLIHLHHKALDRAKDSFLESLALDVKCYESFEALVGGNMLEPEEEWEFIRSLEYQSQTPEDALFIKSLYTIRLKKFNHQEEIFQALKLLKNDYHLSDDPDTAFGLADWLFTHYRFLDCYRITSRILKLHYHHLPTLPLHLTAMATIRKLLPSLFLLAHQLIERDSNSPISWYAAGLWYFSQKRYEESRRFFSKAALLDSRFPEAWFAFGHALAYEGEHDQAITAYSTASHNFQGSHLPLLFIGMEHIQLANPLLANDYLATAAQICPFDPLVMHERGVVCYYQEQWEEAIGFFQKTLDLAGQAQTDPVVWAPTHLNLSHCYRRLRRYSEALQAAQLAKALLPRSPTILTALGMAHHGLGNNMEAIKNYHESLAVLAADPMTTSLLHFSLELETTSGEAMGLREEGSKAEEEAPAEASGRRQIPRLADSLLDQFDANLDLHYGSHVGPAALLGKPRRPRRPSRPADNHLAPGPSS